MRGRKVLPVAWNAGIGCGIDVQAASGAAVVSTRTLRGVGI